MASVQRMAPEQITRILAYAGFVLVGFELVKGMIIKPIKAFYANTNFAKGAPFKSYEQDVLPLHRKEFEACQLYLRDFMRAIDSTDVLSIQALRKHRNDLAHDLVGRLTGLKIEEHQALFENVNRALFKLSNYRAYQEIGAEPKLRDVDWKTVKGHEYLLFEEVVSKVKLLNLHRKDA